MSDIDKFEVVREDFVKWKARNPGATLWDAFKAGKGITPPATLMIPICGEVGADGNVKFTAPLPAFRTAVGGPCKVLFDAMRSIFPAMPMRCPSVIRTVKAIGAQTSKRKPNTKQMSI